MSGLFRRRQTALPGGCHCAPLRGPREAPVATHRSQQSAVPGSGPLLWGFSLGDPVCVAGVRLASAWKTPVSILRRAALPATSALLVLLI